MKKTMTFEVSGKDWRVLTKPAAFYDELLSDNIKTVLKHAEREIRAMEKRR